MMGVVGVLSGLATSADHPCKHGRGPIPQRGLGSRGVGSQIGQDRP